MILPCKSVSSSSPNQFSSCVTATDEITAAGVRQRAGERQGRGVHLYGEEMSHEMVCVTLAFLSPRK